MRPRDYANGGILYLPCLSRFRPSRLLSSAEYISFTSQEYCTDFDEIRGR